MRSERILLLALVLAAAVFVGIGAEDTDAADSEGYSEAIGYYTSNHAYRTAEPLKYEDFTGSDWKFVSDSVDASVADAAYLELFYNNDSTAFDLLKVSSPMKGQYYYGYLTNSSKYYAADVIRLDHGPTQIYLDKGEYTITIRNVSSASSVYLYASDSDGNGIRKDISSASVTFTLSQPVTLTFNGNAKSSSSGNIFAVDYKIDGYRNYKTDDFEVTMEKAKTATTYVWCTGEIYLPEGNITLNSSDRYLFEKGSVEEKSMYDNYVNANKVYDGNGTTKLTGGKTYTVFYLSSTGSVSSLSINYTVNSNNYKYTYITMTSHVNSEYREFYAKAYDHFDIAVEYDSQRYTMYLVSTSGVDLHLESGVLYRVNNESADVYTLKAAPIAGTNAFECDFQMYVSNVAADDNNTMIFAIVCVVLFVIVFLILILSGKKPKWAKEDKE